MAYVGIGLWYGTNAPVLCQLLAKLEKRAREKEVEWSVTGKKVAMPEEKWLAAAMTGEIVDVFWSISSRERIGFLELRGDPPFVWGPFRTW